MHTSNNMRLRLQPSTVCMAVPWVVAISASLAAFVLPVSLETVAYSILFYVVDCVDEPVHSRCAISRACEHRRSGVIGLYMRASFADNKADFMTAMVVMRGLPLVTNTAVFLQALRWCSTARR